MSGSKAGLPGSVQDLDVKLRAGGTEATGSKSSTPTSSAERRRMLKKAPLLNLDVAEHATLDGWKHEDSRASVSSTFSHPSDHVIVPMPPYWESFGVAEFGWTSSHRSTFLADDNFGLTWKRFALLTHFAKISDIDEQIGIGESSP